MVGFISSRRKVRTVKLYYDNRKCNMYGCKRNARYKAGISAFCREHAIEYAKSAFGGRDDEKEKAYLKQMKDDWKPVS